MLSLLEKFAPGMYVIYKITCHINNEAWHFTLTSLKSVLNNYFEAE